MGMVNTEEHKHKWFAITKITYNEDNNKITIDDGTTYKYQEDFFTYTKQPDELELQCYQCDTKKMIKIKAE